MSSSHLPSIEAQGEQTVLFPPGPEREPSANGSAPDAGPSRPIPDGELTDVLAPLLARHFGRPVKIARIDRRVSDYSSSYTLEEVDVTPETGDPLPLVFKNLGWSSLIEEARGVKPKFLFDAAREIEMYRGILNPQRWGTPGFYGALEDPDRDRFWLFLERVPGDKLRFEGDFEVWKQVARWLAAFHRSFSGEAEVRQWPKSTHLIGHDSAFYRRWMDRACAYLKRIRSDRTEEAIARMEILAGSYDEVTDHLSRLPLTLLHGDFFASNVLIARGEGEVRVCPVDWEMAAIGPGPVDLAALVAGGWTRQDREALASVYYETFYEGGAERTSFRDFLRSLDHCRLHLAVQWVGWSTNWTPPSEERQDWLQEALSIAETLGLIEGGD